MKITCNKVYFDFIKIYLDELLQAQNHPEDITWANNYSNWFMTHFYAFSQINHYWWHLWSQSFLPPTNLPEKDVFKNEKHLNIQAIIDDFFPSRIDNKCNQEMNVISEESSFPYSLPLISLNKSKPSRTKNVVWIITYSTI